MFKLLHAGFHRYFKNLMFWIGLAATFICGLICSIFSRELYLEDVYILAEIVIIAVVISWIVGREFDDGIIKNKIIVGHKKIIIFLSEIILGVMVCLIYFSIFSILMAIFNGYIFGVVPINVLVRIFINFLLVNICYTIIFITICCLVPHRAIISTINILLVIMLMFLSNSLDTSLTQPEFFVEYDYEYAEVVDKYGNVHLTLIEVEGSEKYTKNDKYLSGAKRTIAKTIYSILPSSHIIFNTSLLYVNFGYNYYENFPYNDLTYETSESSKFEISDEYNKLLSLNLINSFILPIIITVIGMVLFRKKDFK